MKKRKTVKDQIGCHISFYHNLHCVQKLELIKCLQSKLVQRYILYFHYNKSFTMKKHILRHSSTERLKPETRNANPEQIQLHQHVMLINCHKGKLFPQTLFLNSISSPGIQLVLQHNSWTVHPNKQIKLKDRVFGQDVAILQCERSKVIGQRINETCHIALGHFSHKRALAVPLTVHVRDGSF